jgi:hypothetical protein
MKRIVALFSVAAFIMTGQIRAAESAATPEDCILVNEAGTWKVDKVRGAGD